MFKSIKFLLQYAYTFKWKTFYIAMKNDAE